MRSKKVSRSVKCAWQSLVPARTIRGHSPVAQTSGYNRQRQLTNSSRQADELGRFTSDAAMRTAKLSAPRAVKSQPLRCHPVRHWFCFRREVSRSHALRHLAGAEMFQHHGDPWVRVVAAAQWVRTAGFQHDLNLFEPRHGA
eukprot:SAG11_NODE_4572_length_1847_cov_2.045767_1_plen_142_part_00